MKRILSDADVAAIRAAAASGKSQFDIAREYGVTQTHISRVVNGSRRVIAQERVRAAAAAWAAAGGDPDAVHRERGE